MWVISLHLEDLSITFSMCWRDIIKNKIFSQLWILSTKVLEKVGHITDNPLTDYKRWKEISPFKPLIFMLVLTHALDIHHLNKINPYFTEELLRYRQVNYLINSWWLKQVIYIYFKLAMIGKIWFIFFIFF